jgi:hypothetical protein
VEHATLNGAFSLDLSPGVRIGTKRLIATGKFIEEYAPLERIGSLID